VPYEFAGLDVDVRIVGDRIDVIAGGEVIASHQRGPRRNGYVTNPEHQPAHLENSTGLWTRAYFLRQAAKIGPGTVSALERLLDEKKVEAQGFRSCMNILELAKRGNRALLEQACRGLTEDEHRPISYTAVKNRITLLRAEQDRRPSTLPVGRAPASPPGPSGGGERDTSRAYLAGASAFSLDALTGQGTEASDA
jgi:hypothetical protein